MQAQIKVTEEIFSICTIQTKQYSVCVSFFVCIYRWCLLVGLALSLETSSKCRFVGLYNVEFLEAVEATASSSSSPEFCVALLAQA